VNLDDAARFAPKLQEIRKAIARRIVGLDAVVEQLLVVLSSEGHCLLTGVPGLAKTLLVSTLSELLSLRFARIQFTPDLMPADITGTEVLVQDHESGERSFRFLPGPVFAHVVLADEINRTPPKTQAALLEAMEEGQVTSVGKRYRLERPFFVLATQNPIEQEGTYPLPAAQLDRFMMNIAVDYPTGDEEYRIVRTTISRPPARLEPLLSRDEVSHLLATVRRLEAPPEVLAEATRIVRATRPQSGEALDCTREWLAWGAGPRAIQALVVGAKARALLHGRVRAETGDVWAIARPVLRHRLIPNFRAEASRITTDRIVDLVQETLVGGVPAGPRPGRIARIWTRARGWLRRPGGALTG
jgi:MoxR-like ATPase